MTDTPILAISQIYGGSPSRGLDRDLDGVEFCDAPWLHGLSTGLPERDQVGRYLAGAESNPRLFAFGMDAFRLLPYLDWLTRNPDAFINGASGQLSLDAFGRVHRGLAWLRFDGGVPRAADGALTPQAPQGTP
jgi:outer membrane PBP1 activator LpoA protein